MAWERALDHPGNLGGSDSWEDAVDAVDGAPGHRLAGVRAASRTACSRGLDATSPTGTGQRGRRPGAGPRRLAWSVHDRPMTRSPSPASSRNAWWTVPGASPWSRARSGTDGSAPPGASSPLLRASRSLPAACCHSVRGSDGSGRRSGTCRCSVNGLPTHARLPHFGTPRSARQLLYVTGRGA
jgi:hypothetical protein